EETRRADAALQGRVLQELLLQRVQPLRRGQPLDRRDRAAFDLGGHHQTRIDQAAVEEDVARPAVAVVATLPGARQAQLVAQRLQQALARLAQKVSVLAVDLGVDEDLLAHIRLPLARSTAVCRARLTSTPTR